MSFPTQGYVPTTPIETRLRDQVNNLARIADEEWFASDIVPTPGDETGSKIILEFCYSVKSELEVSFDSGITWCALNNKFRSEAETINTFVIIGLNTDTVNFRAKSAGTIRYARVFEEGGT